jgi:hypothetical protein
MLNLLLSNSQWEDGRLTGRFRKPFDLVAENVALSVVRGAEGGAEFAKHTAWLAISL